MSKDIKSVLKEATKDLLTKRRLMAFNKHLTLLSLSAPTFRLKKLF